MSINIHRLDSTANDFKARLHALLAFEANEDEAIERTVTQILAAVKTRGDAAVLDYTERFDQLSADDISALALPISELKAAFDALSSQQRTALEVAAARIRAYHERQKAECGSHSWHYTDSTGTVLGQKITPLDRIGIYIPGGKAAYPSTVLMNAIPARVAGVSEIVMMVPTPAGVKNKLVLAAASLAAVDHVFTIGGAQAIAALAYGTQTIGSVDKIVGPGNAFVAAAKRRVFGTVGIDMIAGPSEILILCDGTTPPDWIAMDLFAQAEHDELAQSILLCPDADFIERVAQAMDDLLDTLPRHAVIRQSLEKRGALIQVRDMLEACAIANEIAPEHLEISTTQPHQWLPHLRHAGALFIGCYSSESLGDYCAGPNHVLPTSRTARFSSPLGVYDFMKRTSLIEVSEKGAKTLGETAVKLAIGEGLQAHARSAKCRMEIDLKEDD